MSDTTIRIASAVEYERLAARYRHWGYGAGIGQSDVVYVAERDGAPVGLVRRTREHDRTMLRGMHVAPTHHRQGIGTKLLDAVVDDVRTDECFCIPFAHLTSFYGRAGFQIAAEETVPRFLRERLAQYRRAGHDVLLMRRWADTQPNRAD